jgi:hypothetical protein
MFNRAASNIAVSYSNWITSGYSKEIGLRE